MNGSGIFVVRRLFPMWLAVLAVAMPTLSAADDASIAVSPAPPASEAGTYPDVRIGDPRTGARSVDLDFHKVTGNLFAAVEWGDGWSLNISTDKGASWQETYFYPFESIMSMKVGGDYVWVAYSSTGVPTELRMRRFSVVDGLSDVGYHFYTIADHTPYGILDVSMTSNADDVDAGTYVAAIATDYQLYFYWDDYVGTSWEPSHPSVAHAAGGLDLTVNPYSPTAYFFHLVYRTGTVAQILRKNLFGPWELVQGAVLDGTNDYTSISAYRDTVMAAFESDYTNGNGITQHMNENAGDPSEWGAFTMYLPSAGGSPEAFGPDVSVRSPSGSIVTYQLEEGAFDGVYYRYLHGHEVDFWDAPVMINEIDSASGEQTTVEWLGALCVGSYGVVYLSGGDFIPYFDLISPRAFFCNGFESGDLTAWSSTIP